MRPDAPRETKAAVGGSSLSDKPQAERQTAKSASGGTIWAATVSAPCFAVREDCIVAFVTCAASSHVNDGSVRPLQDGAAEVHSLGVEANGTLAYARIALP